MGPNAAQWAAFKNIIDSAAMDSFGLEIITWGRRQFKESANGEDTGASYTYRDLKVLIQYNPWRTWPTTEYTPTGEMDSQNMVAFINLKYLEDEELLDSNKNLLFDPAEDIFVHRGILYKCDGETFMSQASDTPLHKFLIFKRQTVPSGTQKYGQSPPPPSP
jgi:hypothetical protein